MKLEAGTAIQQLFGQEITGRRIVALPYFAESTVKPLQWATFRPAEGLTHPSEGVEVGAGNAGQSAHEVGGVAGAVLGMMQANEAF